jgi:heme-degrading monooxygenase HmoA
LLIQTTTFRLAEGADEHAFLESDRLAQAELSSKRGLVRRTTARSDDGSWLVITLWRSRDDAEAAPSPGLEGVDDLTVETRWFSALD